MAFLTSPQDPRWRHVWIFHRLMVGGLLGWLPLGAVLLSLNGSAAPSFGATVVGFAYFASFGAVAVTYGVSTCPNCRHNFVSGTRWAMLLDPRCARCNARIGDPITVS